MAAANRDHGRSETPEYAAWYDMIRRCLDPNNKRYADYGARGITVCERWQAGFLNFLSDMGERPGRGYSLDRIDNDKGYETGNCRWATMKQQAANRRRPVRRVA